MFHMNVAKCLSLFIVLVGINLSFAQNRQIHFETGTWAEAIEKAKSEQKPIFLDAYAVWCGPCKWMSANVFTNDSVADFYNANFINVKMDMEKGEGIELAKKWQIRAFPTLLYFDANGELMHQVCGALPAKPLVESGNTARNEKTRLRYYVDEYNNGNRSFEFVEMYLRELENACGDTKLILNGFLEGQQQDDLLNEGNWKLMKELLQDYNSKSFQFIEKNADKFANSYGKEEVDKKLMSIYNRYLMEAFYAQKPELVESRKKEILAKKTVAANQTIDLYNVRLLASKKDWMAYFKSVDKFITKYKVNDWELLNDFAWNVYEQVKTPKTLKKALGWADTSVETFKNFMNLDTQAHILEALGRVDEAIKVQTEAVKLATEANYPNTNEFETYLEQLKGKK